jgi:hypothetical protein
MIELPPAPEPLPADTFEARFRIWRADCDDLLRQATIAASQAHGAAQAATAEAMQASVAAQNALAAAISSTPASGGFSEAFVMSLLRLVLDKPEPAVG